MAVGGLLAQDHIYRGKREFIINHIRSLLVLNMSEIYIHIHHRHVPLRITNDGREDEMEDNMQQVGSVLGNLKNMAADMGQEIDRQNQQLDKVGAKVQYFLEIFF